MPNLLYSNVEARQLGVGVRTRAGWWHWAKGAWTSPFVAADHVRPCTRDRDVPEIQDVEIPSAALVPGASLIDGIMGPSGTFTPSASINAPGNYIEFGARCGSVSWVH